MARVWRAWDPSLQSYVALKEPLFDPRYSAEVLEEVERRFIREAQVGARLRGHPGIVTVYAADVYDGRPAVAMELVEGATLGDILANGPLDQASALDALDQLLDAVGYAHSMGVVHRDLKPDNIFVDKSGCVKVADFGIAGVNDSSYVKATVVSVVIGTPGYMSPEQAMGRPVDARSDIFSIGVIAYEMLTGRNPFGASEGVDSTKLLYRIVHEPVEPLPCSVSATLPKGVEAAIMAALSKQPEDRPYDAATFKAMLHISDHETNAGRTAAAAAVAGTPSTQGGTLIMAANPAYQKRTPAALSASRWVPVVAITAVCVILLVGAVVATPSAGGGAAGGLTSSSAAVTSATSSTAASESSANANGQGTSDDSSNPDATSAPHEQQGEPAQSEQQPDSPAVESAAVAADSSASEPEALQPEPVQPEAASAEQSDSVTYYEPDPLEDYAPNGEFWGVWIDSFFDMGSAYSCADDARASGLPATVYEIPDTDGTYYVVSAGEFATRAEAESLVAQAQSLGYYNAYTSTATYL